MDNNDLQLAILNELKEIKAELKKPKTKKICPKCKEHTFHVIKKYPQDEYDLVKLECLNPDCNNTYKGVDKGIFE